MPARAWSSRPRRWPTWVGQAAATLEPLIVALRAHVFAGPRLHGDDTPVPVLAKGKTRTGRLWVYVRDDRPFAGAAAPAACFFHSPDRGGEYGAAHLQGHAGLLQVDAYAGFERLHHPARRPGPITEVACWAHARRKFCDLARSLNRWDALTRFLDAGRMCMTNNAAWREIRAVAVGRANWTFAGSDAGGERAAAIYSLIAAAKLNHIDPRAWLADVLARLPDHPARRLEELLPWNWLPPNAVTVQAA